MSPLATASSRALARSSADCSASPALPSSSLVLFCNSTSGCSTLVVCCVIVSVTEGEGDGLKFRERIVVPFGCSTVGITRWTPKAFFKEPEICLNLGTLNSAKDNIKTKKAIKRVAMSANVAIQAGAPTGGHFGHSSSSFSSSSTASSAILIYLF